MDAYRRKEGKMISDITDGIDVIFSVVSAIGDMLNLADAIQSISSDRNNLSTYIFAKSNENIYQEKFFIITTIIKSKKGKVRIIKRVKGRIEYRKILIFSAIDTYNSMEKIIDNIAKKYKINFEIKNLSGKTYFQARREILRELKGEKNHPTTAST